MAQTANYNLEKPDITRNVDEEFYQLQETLDLLDSILAALQTAVNGKSAVGHTHAIADVLDLAAQLAAKMPASTTFALDDLTDVSGAAGAPDNYVLVKSALGWIPSSALAALGTHGHLISEITGLVDALAGKADAGATTTALAGKADAATTITAGTGLTGGGDLSAGRTISADIADEASARLGENNTELMTPLRSWQQGGERDGRWLRAWDQKTTGTEGGSSSSGVNVRALNQSTINIDGASLSSNQITLPAGDYEISARVPSFNSSRTKAYLRTAAGTLLVNGGSAFSAGGNAEVNMHIQGRFTLGATTAVEIVMNCSGFQSTTGLGNAGNASGIPEIYTDVMIWKVD